MTMQKYVFRVHNTHNGNIFNHTIMSSMSPERYVQEMESPIMKYLGYTCEDGTYVNLEAQKEIVENAKADQVYVVKRNIHPRYVTGFRAVYIENKEVKKEIFKTQKEAQKACVINGRTAKRVEVIYSQYRVTGELMNGTNLTKIFKYEKDAVKFLENVSLEFPKLVKIN